MFYKNTWQSLQYENFHASIKLLIMIYARIRKPVYVLSQPQTSNSWGTSQARDFLGFCLLKFGQSSFFSLLQCIINILVISSPWTAILSCNTYTFSASTTSYSKLLHNLTMGCVKHLHFYYSLLHTRIFSSAKQKIGFHKIFLSVAQELERSCLEETEGVVQSYFWR